MEFTKIDLGGSSHYYFCSTKKFVNITLFFSFIDRVKKEEMTAISLLSYILNYCNDKYRTTKKLNQQKDLLYGCNIRSNCMVSGDLSVFSFGCSAVNPKFLNDDDYKMKDILSFFHTLFTPYLSPSKDKFNEKIFRICKDNLYDDLLRMEEDKEFAVYMKLHDLIDDEIYNIRGRGYIDEINNITNEQCYALFKKIIKRPLHAYFIGDMRKSELSNFMNRQFLDANYTPIKANNYYIKHQDKVAQIVETKDLSQSIIGLSFTSKINENDKSYYAMQIFNSIFGNSGFSKLFLNIREKYGYCYNISSYYDTNNGMIFVLAGINYRYKDKCYKLILKQLEQMQKGKISTKEIKLAKIHLISEYENYIDSASSIIANRLNRDLARKRLDNQEMIEKIKKVTIEDLIYCAGQLRLKDYYFLAQKEGDE